VRKRGVNCPGDTTDMPPLSSHYLTRLIVERTGETAHLLYAPVPGATRGSPPLSRWKPVWLVVIPALVVQAPQQPLQRPSAEQCPEPAAIRHDRDIHDQQARRQRRPPTASSRNLIPLR
jgi:hypothetical protein